jgi:hypothetical protein
MSTFIAQYKGTCAACDLEIKPGDEVQYTSTKGITHVLCPEQDDDTKHYRYQGTSLEEMGY